MILRLLRRRRQASASAPHDLFGCFQHLSIRRFCATLGLTMALGLMALGAKADTHIYFYDSGGNPVDVTASYHYQDHDVYDSYGNLVGTVDSQGRIYDLSNQQIGYIVTTPN